MDELTIPADLKELASVEAADELLASIQGAATDLFGSGNPTDEQLALLQTYAEAATAISARKTELAADAETRAAQVAELAAQLGIDGDAGESDSDSEDAGESEDEGETSDDSEDEDGKEGEASSKPAFAGVTVPRRAKTVPMSAKPKPPTAAPNMFAATDGIGRGQALEGIGDVAAAFMSKFNAGGLGSDKGDSRLPVVSLRREFPKELTSDGTSFGITQALARAASFDSAAFVAACGPVATAFNVEVCGERGTPLRSATPAIQVPRLNLSYAPGQSWRSVAAGVDSRDCADTADKVAYDFDCVPPVAFCATAHYTYATFPNTMQFANPEQLQADLQKLMIAYDSDLETSFLDTIAAGSTAVTSGAAALVGALRTYVADVTRAAAQYRRRHRLSANATLILVVQPDLYDLLRTDALQDAEAGVISARMGDQDIDAIFAARNLSVIRTMDTSTGTSTMDAAQGAGLLNGWDCTVDSFLYAPGTWVVGEGNQLNIGYFRDSALAAKNRVGYFSEEWIGLLKTGCESIRLTTSVNLTGAAPLGVVGRDGCVAG